MSVEWNTLMGLLFCWLTTLYGIWNGIWNGYGIEYGMEYGMIAHTLGRAWHIMLT